MSLHKTDKARAELTPGSRSLGQRERTLLLLADGNKSPQDLGWMFGGEAGILLQKLMQEGYLEKRASAGITLPFRSYPFGKRPPCSVVSNHSAASISSVSVKNFGSGNSRFLRRVESTTASRTWWLNLTALRIAKRTRAAESMTISGKSPADQTCP